ncbi:MAG: hypothetical protein AABY22_29990 [Nanoarchaeota archaeon]
MTTKIADKDVEVKLSVCGKCNGIIRVAVLHLMDKKTKADFAKEAMEHNLSVKQQPLIEYRKENAKWCDCI